MAPGKLSLSLGQLRIIRNTNAGTAGLCIHWPRRGPKERSDMAQTMSVRVDSRRRRTLASADGSKKTVYVALAGNLAIAVAKFAAAWFTGSSAMLSEGAHSLVDCGNEILLLHGMKRAARPPDLDHQFGHGREVY